MLESAEVQVQMQHRQTRRRRCHICIVTETYPPDVNGVAMTLARLVHGLLSRGHSVSVARPHRSAARQETKSEHPLLLVRGLPLPGYTGLLFGLPAGAHIRNCWARQRPDVVYVATEGPLGWSAVRTAQDLGIPIFSGFHTNFHSYSKHYRIGWLHNTIFHYLRWFHNQTRGTFVPSRDLQARLQTLGFENVSVLSRGVDSQLFNPARRCPKLRRHWGVAENELAVLYVGRVAPEKNLDLAIRAYRAMQSANARVKFIIVGDGPLAATLYKEQPDLIFCGLQTGEQLARHYASADVFLFPSETETFGNVILEAMASGLAVVAYEYAAAQMHITQGETGVLVPYGNARAFIDAAVGLVREPRTVESLRKNVRPYAVSVSWQRIVEQFESVLTRSLDRPLPVTAPVLPIPQASGG